MTALPGESPTPRPAAVGLIARDPLRIEGVRTLLEDNAACRVTLLKAPRAKDLADLDLVLIDTTATDHLFALLGAFQRMRPLLRLLVVGETDDIEWTEEVLAAGAHGYLSHVSTSSEFLRAVEVVRDGSIWAPRKVLARLLERARRKQETASETTLPSRREREVLRLLLNGRSNQEIASHLQVHVGTVKSHLARLMRKAGVNNRTALTLRAISIGWCDVPKRE